jgi:catechol 2,3-dioxygenase-like lactoylglutathione lyase family enzyme
MLDLSAGFSGFSVADPAATRTFYGEVLGLDAEEKDGMVWLHLAGGRDVLLYPKGEGHTPATYTVLNFPVDDVPAAVAELRGRGVRFERYEGTPLQTDEDGVFRGGGPLIAWFTDPSGNVLSVIEAD